MNKTAIKNFAIWARRKLISDITYKAGMLGVSDNGIAQPLPQSTRDLQFFDIGTKDYAEVSGVAIEQRNALINVIRAREKGSDYKTAFRNVVEEVAYTWFNRLIAVRFMEVNDYLPSHIRVLSSENEGKLEPDFVTSPFDTDLEFSAYERDLVYQLKDENKLDELFRMLFIRQCNKLSEILPGLFEQISDYTELLLNISFTDKDGIVYHLTHDISEDEFNVEKEGQVEIIGWLYQYYNTEPKDEVFALLKKNVKITKERIPAATQLFTPDWIVRYMVENSLGRLWVEGHPSESLKGNWKYYLEEAEQEPDVVVQLNKIREEYAKLSPTDIKVIDPCMGSGHILVHAFDVLMQIYTSQGYIEREAAKSILIHNLYGIDIDVRAYQLAYFAVMMKARQYNRRIFQENITPNLIAIRNPENISKTVLKQLGDLEPVGQRLVEDFQDAEEYGSILQVNYTEEELQKVEQKLAEIEQEAQYGNLLVQMEAAECVRLIRPLIKQATLLSQKYDVVVTNPPYMGNNGMSTELTGFVKKYYPDSKSDLFAVFIERCRQMLKTNRYQSMITQHAWMFLTSYEALRKKIQNERVVNLLHLGPRAFDEISGEVVQTVSFVFSNNRVTNYLGTYVSLTAYSSENGKREGFLSRRDMFIRGQEDFSTIQGTPFTAYWARPQIITAFKQSKLVGDIAEPRVGMATANNERFVRQWYEVNRNQFFEDCNSREAAKQSKKKWFPFAMGGEQRKWYGNNEAVVNWFNDGFEIQNFKDEKTGRIRSHNYNLDYIFSSGLTWTVIGTEKTSFRYCPVGFLYSNSGYGLFCNEETTVKYLLSFLNSGVATSILKILSPSMGFESGYLRKLPLIFNTEDEMHIIKIVDENIRYSRLDWDSFETSWDFKRHPLIEAESYIRENPAGAFADILVGGRNLQEEKSRVGTCYLVWESQCLQRFEQLKQNEEELNRIFIDIYSLQDELTPEVADKDVTVRKADLSRDIRSLVSYAVGCMFGRYSLDVSGLTYAGGEWDDSKYSTFLPDLDNCIPITDEEYFTDDIVGRFVEFIRAAFGPETLEENLNYIAKALGNKGNTSREVIRNYFLNDFYKDHLKIYQKRPIYWLFDSGKQNGFKALVYMHRWNADTVGNLRIEYLHKMQTVYEHEIENCQDMIDHGSGRDVATATKRKEKLIKQLKECKDYDEKVAHIAFSKISIDLDDGVKVNYRKVQTGADGKFCEILANSKDIMVKEK